MGLALSSVEQIFYYNCTWFGRNPTEAELMMFVQVNSEHCRHKIFNGQLTIDGELQSRSLFDMIKTRTLIHRRGCRWRIRIMQRFCRVILVIS